jgi:transcriptional regulator with XRE-family HTH domain
MLENTEITIAQKIKNIRALKNLSQDRFGKKIGKSGKTISAYESGRCVPTLKVLDDISQVYDVTFIHTNNDRKEQLKRKLDYLKTTIRDIESVILTDEDSVDSN